MPTLFLLSDPHLGKDMTPFGDHWRDHPEKIRAAWEASVQPDDIVLVPGDISWSKTPEGVAADLAWLAALPGRLKVIIKGNHDWWWTSTQKVRDALPDSLVALDGDAVALDGLIVAGCKGYLSPPDPYYKPRDESAHKKNLRKAEAALADARALRKQHPMWPAVFCLHYPPFASNGERTEYADAIEQAGFITACVFGHFHFTREWAVCPQGEINGVTYHLGSCDFLQFAPKPLLELPPLTPVV
ncbi:MAG: metallophosphoesterase [Planctomycetota bacterium]